MNQSYEQEQQCFIPARVDEQSEIRQKLEQHKLDNINISSILPSANQLRYIQLPTDMIPRTCFLQLNMKSYPSLLDVDCEQLQPQANQGVKVRNTVKNEQQKSLRQYFKSQQYKVIYDRISKYVSMKFSQDEIMNRFKNISLYQQYHERMFKKLQSNEENKTKYVRDDDNFDSNFQCGNLGRVYVKLHELSREYYLLLQNDINSHGYTSWFFFKVLSCGPGTVKFHILNMVKTPTMYRSGMNISIFSAGKWSKVQKGWFKGGQNINAYQNKFPKQFKEDSFYSSLYFQYTFTGEEDEVYFAMSQPYSYSRLISYINRNYFASKNRTVMQNNSTQQNQQSCQCSNRSTININVDENQKQDRRLNCNIVTDFYSICNNIIPIIQIWKGQLEKSKRKAIIFMGRQHPAQVVGSFIMEEIMTYFYSETQIPQDILNEYLVIFVPMVNPDGVIHGNSRCNFAGLDLNRQWMQQSIKETTPQNVSLRKYIWNIQEKHGIQYLIDLHGHSKKMGSFFFSSKNSEKNPHWYFPFVVSKMQPIFDFYSCTYNITPDKKNTLRNQLYEEGMKNCLTLQNSYIGYFTPQGIVKSFSKKDFISLSKSVINCLYFVLKDGRQEKSEKILKNLGFSRQNFMASYSQISKRQINSKLVNCIENQNQLDSDSQPEQGLLKPEQLQKILDISDQPKKNKKECINFLQNRKLRSRKQNQRLTTAHKKQQGKQQDIRKSYPFDIRSKQQDVEKITYKSEKKIHVFNTTKAITQQKRIIKPQPVIKRIINKINKKQITDKKIATHQLKIKPQMEKKSIKSLSRGGAISVFTNYPVNETTTYHIKKKKHQFYDPIAETTREKKKSLVQKKQNPVKIDEDQIKNFLNQTLSILKVNGLSRPRKSSEDQVQKAKDPQHDIFDKMVKSGMRVKTESPYVFERQEQSNLRKKILNRNYRKQILKRKKLLNSKQDSFKFKRFQNFMDTTSLTKGQFKSSKVQGSSVFYHFPVL